MTTTARQDYLDVVRKHLAELTNGPRIHRSNDRLVVKYDSGEVVISNVTRDEFDKLIDAIIADRSGLLRRAAAGLEDTAAIDTDAADDDPVNHPRHYNSHPSGIETIDIIRHMTFDLGNAVKYVMRAEHKGGLQDLKKASWSLADHLKHFGSGEVKISPEAVKRLFAITTHEPDPLRRRFYLAVELGRIEEARYYVEDMIKEAS